MRGKRDKGIEKGPGLHLLAVRLRCLIEASAMNPALTPGATGNFKLLVGWLSG